MNQQRIQNVVDAAMRMAGEVEIAGFIGTDSIRIAASRANEFLSVMAQDEDYVACVREEIRELAESGKIRLMIEIVPQNLEAELVAAGIVSTCMKLAMIKITEGDRLIFQACTNFCMSVKFKGISNPIREAPADADASKVQTLHAQRRQQAYENPA